MRLIEAKTAKEFASTFFTDPILKMAVHAAIDNAPGFDLVRCKDCISGKGSTYKVCPLYKQGLMKDSDYCSVGEKKDNE